MNTQSAKKRDSVDLCLISSEKLHKSHHSNIVSFSATKKAKQLEEAKSKVYEAASNLDW
jgi:hypothetical protein